MKRILFWGLAVAMAAGFLSTSHALPPLPTYVTEHYSASPEYAKFVAAFQALESKCDACHKPGADKKAKGHGLNDFGDAVHKHLKHRDFNAAHKLKEQPEELAKAKKLVDDALSKAEGEKNAAGQAFGELIKAGQLPGRN